MTVVGFTGVSPAMEEQASEQILVVSSCEEGRQLAEMLDGQSVRTTYTEVMSHAQLTIRQASPARVLMYLNKESIGPLQLIDIAVDQGATVIVVGPGSPATVARQCLKRGAARYLASPVTSQHLLDALGLSPARNMRNVVSSKGLSLHGASSGMLFSGSGKMQQVARQVQRVAPTSATVFIQGESGTGKEVVAQSIHQLSARYDQPFVPVNCGAISPQLIESELFGHEKGSFTGAVREHKGVFERAHGGTLFLDEITEMPFDLQVRLLRVLETHRFTRVGSDREMVTDCRIVAATNRCPEEEVRDGRFRADLLYRLQVFPIVLPPLRERPEDIKLLAEAFLEELNKREGTQKQLAQEAVTLLRGYTWPGNLRELRNVIQRAFIMADEVIGLSEIPRDIVQLRQPAPRHNGPCLRVTVGSSIAEVERDLIFATLDECRGKKEKAASILGVSMKTLYNRLRDYDNETADPADHP